MKVITILIVAVATFFECNILESLNGGDPPNPNKLYNAKDSLFIRELLDSNGLASTPATPTMEIQGNNLVSVAFYPKGNILVLPSVIDSLPSGIIIGAGSKLDSVIIPSKLHNPIRLFIRNNQFKDYPNSLFKLAENSTVALSFNQITYLPDEIMSFKFQSFEFNYNNICNPSDSLKNWLSKWNPNWEKYQMCP